MSWSIRQVCFPFFVRLDFEWYSNFSNLAKHKNFLEIFRFTFSFLGGFKNSLLILLVISGLFLRMISNVQMTCISNYILSKTTQKSKPLSSVATASSVRDSLWRKSAIIASFFPFFFLNPQNWFWKCAAVMTCLSKPSAVRLGCLKKVFGLKRDIG